MNSEFSAAPRTVRAVRSSMIVAGLLAMLLLLFLLPTIQAAPSRWAPSSGDARDAAGAVAGAQEMAGAATRIPSFRTPVPDSLYPNPEDRVGVVAFGTSRYDLLALNAGFIKLEDRGPRDYERPLRMDFMTVFQVGPGFYELPDKATYWGKIAAMVEANPGYLWFIGNEPENPHRGRRHSAQYAKIYYEMYTFIKQHDRTAQVGIGGVVLPSPFRRKWLESVLGHYKATYGEPMPVDVWNIHNLLLSECPRYETVLAECKDDTWLLCSGGYLPQEFGCQRGLLFSQDDQAVSSRFIQLIRDFRSWMNTREEARGKPLVITEMGVFAFRRESGGQFPHDRISDFMYETFDFMMTAKDPLLGYAPDGNRLVQRWAWYALNDTGFNGYLFDDNAQLTDFGRDLANYSAQFIPWSPTTIFFQKGWTGYDNTSDITLASGRKEPANPSLYLSADGSERPLLWFDLSRLPVHAEVVSATLTFYTWVHQGVGAVTVNAHEVTRPWTIGSVGWLSATQNSAWQGPGCSGDTDRNPDPADSVVVSADKTFYSLDVTGLASKWVANPASNNGVLLVGGGTGTGDYTLVSSDQQEANEPMNRYYRPKLELTVRLADPTPTATATSTHTSMPTATPTSTSTATATSTVEPTGTPTRTASPTVSRTPTSTAVATSSATASATASATSSSYRLVLPILRRMS